MPYAIIRSGGKQYRVIQGQRVRLERLVAEVGDAITLGEVLALGEGAQCQFGAPLLAGKAVEAKVVRHGRGKKCHTWKFRRRKGFSRRMGHRQDYTEVQITGIPS